MREAVEARTFSAKVALDTVKRLRHQRHQAHAPETGVPDQGQQHPILTETEREDTARDKHHQVIGHNRQQAVEFTVEERLGIRYPIAVEEHLEHAVNHRRVKENRDCGIADEEPQEETPELAPPLPSILMLKDALNPRRQRGGDQEDRDQPTLRESPEPDHDAQGHQDHGGSLSKELPEALPDIGGKDLEEELRKERILTRFRNRNRRLKLLLGDASPTDQNIARVDDPTAAAP